MGRLLVSLLLVSPVWLLPYVLIPGLDATSIRATLSGGAPPELSIAALGFTAVIGAFQLVEFVALAVPRLRWRRLGGRDARRPLTLAALVLAGCIGLVQGFFICRWLESARLDPFVRTDLLAHQGWAFFAPAMLALLGGLAVLVGCAHLIGRWGLGNGYSLLLAAAAGSGIVEDARRNISLQIGDQVPPGFLLLGVASMAALVWGCARLSRGALSRQLEIAEGLRLRTLPPTSGVYPIILASSLLMLPGQLANLGLPLERLTERLVPGSTEYVAGELVLVGAMSLLLSSAFYPPGIVLRFFEELCNKLGLISNTSSAELSRELRRSALHSVPLLCAVPLLGHFLGRHLPIVSLLDPVVLALVLIDLAREWRARRADPTLVPAFELHRLYAVDPVRHLLEARGIPVALRGLQHRRLLYFFGPFVPVELLVPRARAAEARELTAAWLSAGRR